MAEYLVLSVACLKKKDWSYIFYSQSSAKIIIIRVKKSKQIGIKYGMGGGGGGLER